MELMHVRYSFLLSFSSDRSSIRFKHMPECPTPLTFSKYIDGMLSEDGYSSANFIAHSLGSAYCAYFLRKTSLVKNVILIDPVCFKVHYSLLD